MAARMVFVIVTRHIGLSVGALLATCTAVMDMAQTAWLRIVLGLITGATIGAAQGWLTG